MKRVYLFSLMAAMAALSFSACKDDVPPHDDNTDVENTDVQSKEVGECGDGVWNKGEDCEGNMGLAGKTCGEGIKGSVKCTACKIDYSACEREVTLADKYEATYDYDLSGIVPEEVYTVEQIMKDPAKELSTMAVDYAWNEICAFAKSKVSMDVCSNTVFTSMGFDKKLKEALTNVVNDALTDYVGSVSVTDSATEDTRPEAIKVTSEATSALLGMIKDFKVNSTMTLTQQSDVEYKVSEKWDSLAFDWSYNCTENCTQLLKVDEMGLTTGNNLTAEYTVNYYEQQAKAEFADRNFTMAYGTIIEWIYKNKIIPAVTKDNNAHDGAALLKYLVKPEDLAQKICDNDRVLDETTGEYVWKDDGDHENWNSGVSVNLGVVTLDVKAPKTLIVTIFDSVLSVAGGKIDEYIASVVDLGKATLETSGSFVIGAQNADAKIGTLSAVEDNAITGKVSVENPADNSSSAGISMKVTASAVAK